MLWKLLREQNFNFFTCTAPKTGPQRENAARLLLTRLMISHTTNLRTFPLFRTIVTLTFALPFVPDTTVARRNKRRIFLSSLSPNFLREVFRVFGSFSPIRDGKPRKPLSQESRWRWIRFWQFSSGASVLVLFVYTTLVRLEGLIFSLD